MDNNEISLYEYGLVIWKHRNLILKIAGAVFFVALLITVFSKNTYTAKTSFYYPLSESSGGGVVQKLLGNSELSDMASMLAPGLGPNLQNYTKGILESRTIADQLIDRYNLMHLYHTRYRSLAEKRLASATTIDMTKEGIMEISVQSGDPKLSADLANGYVEAFQEYSAKSLLSVAKKHRIDVQKQLALLKKKLQAAEADMTAFQALHKTADFTEEARQLMKAFVDLRVQELSTRMALQTAKETLARSETLMAGHLKAGATHPLVSPNLADPIFMNLRQQLADLYVRYAQAKATETPGNPELESLTEQVKDLESAVRKQLERQAGSVLKGSSGYLLEPEIKVAELTAKLSATRDGIKEMDGKFETYPTIGLAYMRKARNLKVLETLYTFLSTEYEKARLEEEKEAPNLQVLDAAVPPDFKSGPHRLLNLLIGLLLGVFLGIGAAFAIESFKPPAHFAIPGDGHAVIERERVTKE